MVGTAGIMLAFQLPRDGETVELRSTGQPKRAVPSHKHYVDYYPKHHQAEPIHKGGRKGRLWPFVALFLGDTHAARAGDDAGR